MKIVIVGCGQIGLAIIKSLLNEKHDVLAIDSNPAVVENVINSLDVMGICDKGVTYTKLKEAGVDKSDIFIAMTDSDEINTHTSEGHVLTHRVLNNASQTVILSALSVKTVIKFSKCNFPGHHLNEIMLALLLSSKDTTSIT